jgi:copper chaperone
MGYSGPTMELLTYSVPGMHCGHCTQAVERELSAVDGVAAVEADLESKLVTVRGEALSDEALREAIEEAGYEAA